MPSLPFQTRRAPSHSVVCDVGSRTLQYRSVGRVCNVKDRNLWLDQNAVASAVPASRLQSAK